ncbi:ATP-binding cassette domain-containing protein [Lacibacter sp.]|uniref:ATP-binding cassette domain-containing protein n=1 Tax=Lacibacter sp. TaxID=1915409 RepID=UPI002B4B2E28|nr:ATP-binding cassette domain-containing protein [Lacibacter sp.]HLP38482.1 ATP-binding cassette domain-containing protein [Lacibacter sp.]
MQRFAIFLSNTFNKQSFIQQLLDKKAIGIFASFNSSDAVLFSAYTVQQYLLEEEIHGYSGIEATRNQTLRSMSSGEQKKVLLQHLLSLKPGLLILDNVFDNLDTAAQAMFKEDIQLAAAHTQLIQLSHRKRDLLPFIENRLTIRAGEFVPLERNTDDEIHVDDAPVPSALHNYQLSTTELVRFNDVHVSYDGRQVLQQINWTINAGEFWQLKGPNGSGKTTLLTMITGDNVKGYGQQLYLFGRKKGSGESVWDIKDKIGYLTPAMTDLFSTRHTLLHMIVSGFVDSIGLYTIPSDMQLRSAYEWLQLLQLQDKANIPFPKLTQGEQRLALVARAMVKHPPLLILDEPLMGLDDTNTEKIIQLINKLAAETSTAVLYVSHQTENGLQPQKVFELVKTENGSTGTIHD